MLEPAIVTAVTFILMFSYIGLRRIAGYAWIVDPCVLILHIWMFKGTYSGMMTGLLSGLIVAVVLKIVRQTQGYEKMRVRRVRGHIVPTFKWEEIKP